MDNAIYEPRINGKVTQEIGILSTSKNIMSIGSGLVISKNSIKILKEKYNEVFDPRFYLYGVDSTFYIRFNRCNFKEPTIIISPIEHSLSRVCIESKKVKQFRAKERAYSMALYLIFYEKIHYRYLMFIRILFKNTLLLLLNKTISVNPYDFVIAFIKAKHYRNNK